MNNWKHSRQSIQAQKSDTILTKALKTLNLDLFKRQNSLSLINNMIL